MEVKIRFRNYGLVPNEEFNMHEGTVFFIKGHNDRGKSTFLNALKSIMEVKDEKVNTTTFGEEDGEIICSIPGADKQQYQVRYDFDKNGKKKFKFVNPEGRVLKTVGEMRAVFNYSHITMSDWLKMSESEEGRRKQRETLMSLMSDEEKASINEIDAKINGSTGTLFKERTAKNTSVAARQMMVDKLRLSKEDLDLYGKRNEIKAHLDALCGKAQKYEEILANSETGRINLDHQRKELSTLVENHNQTVSRLDSTILELEHRLKLAKEERANAIKVMEQKSKDLEASINELKVKVDEEAIKDAMIQLTLDKEENGQMVFGLRKRIANGTMIYDKIKDLEKRHDTFLEEEKQLNNEKEEALDLTNQINDLRAEKVRIVKESSSIPPRWGIEDTGLTYDGLPFLLNDISTSKAVRAVAELMAIMNQAPVMLMGDSESLGYEILQELADIAKDMGKIMIFAEHDRTKDDLELVCYDEIDTPEMPTTKTVKTKPQEPTNLF